MEIVMRVMARNQLSPCYWPFIDPRREDHLYPSTTCRPEEEKRGNWIRIEMFPRLPKSPTSDGFLLSN